MILGAHVSISGGISKSVERAYEIGCETLQIFTKNQIQWKIPRLKDEEIKKFKANLDKFGIFPGTVHSSYLVNIASPDKFVRSRSISNLSFDLIRTNLLGMKYLIFHPGAHKGKGERYALDAIVDGINEIFERVSESKTMLLLETTAGQGSNVGYRFEHLAYVLSHVNNSKRLGICVDTCHIFAAGYDFREKYSYKRTMKDLETVIGFENVKAFHLNDSKGELGSKIDRHEEIGKGQIGIKAFELLINDENFSNVIGIIETPGGESKYKVNISLLKSLRR